MRTRADKLVFGAMLVVGVVLLAILVGMVLWFVSVIGGLAQMGV